MVGYASFLDIFVLGAVENFVFITSVDMSETPVLGDIIRKVTAFIPTGRRR